MPTATANVTETTNLNALIMAEWRNRPDDERFVTLDALHEHCLARANRCEAIVTNTKRVRPLALPMQENMGAVPGVGQIAPEEADRFFGLLFETEAGHVDATHWAFGQLAKTVKTPADYLRRLDTRFAERVIDYGFSFLAERDEYQLFAERVEGRGQVKRLRAFTGKGFGRIYDHEVVEAVQHVADPTIWQPPVHRYSGEAGTRKATTLYGSDRDMTIFLCDDRNPIEIRVGDRREVLARGFFVRNSEVGLTKFTVAAFFYRYDCDNRLIWTPTSVQQIGITHSSGAPERFRREAVPMLERFAAADMTEVRDRVERAMTLEVGRTKESVVEWLGRQGFSKEKGGKVYDRAIEEEGRATTVWDLIQGGTALARSIPHTDARIEEEERFGGLLRLAA